MLREIGTMENIQKKLSGTDLEQHLAKKRSLWYVLCKVKLVFKESTIFSIL